VKNKTKLPKQIVVFWDGESPNQYLAAQETNLGIADGQVVGIYDLVETRTQSVTETLV
jgi:hypothetical protein